MANKPVPAISVNKMYYALVLSDTEEGVTYSAPVWLQGVNTVAYNPNTQTASWDADGGTYELCGRWRGSDDHHHRRFEPGRLCNADGRTARPARRYQRGVNDNPPEVAIGFMSEKSDGLCVSPGCSRGNFPNRRKRHFKGGAGITFQPYDHAHGSAAHI